MGNMVNLYTRIGNIQTLCEAQGFQKDIPYEIFGKALMLEYGMKKRTAGEWIRSFIEVGLITMDEQRRINFK